MVMLEAFETDELEELHGSLPLGRPHPAGNLAADDRVREHRAPRQEVVALEDKAAIGAGPTHRPAVEPNLARCGGVGAPPPPAEPGLSAPPGGRQRGEPRPPAARGGAPPPLP